MSVPLDNHPDGLDPDEESKLSLFRRMAEEAFRELDPVGRKHQPDLTPSLRQPPRDFARGDAECGTQRKR